MTREGTTRARPAWSRRSLVPYLITAHIVRVGFAAAAAYPIAAITSRTLAGWPRGDAMLFDPGGLMLLEVARLHRPALWAAAEQAALLLLIAVPIGAVVEALLIGAISTHEGSGLTNVAARVTKVAGALGAMAAARVLAIGGVAAATYVLWQGLLPSLRAMLGEPAGDATSLVILGLGVLVVLAVEVVYDVSRTASVLDELDAPRALAAGFMTAARRFWACVFAYGARGAGALFAVVAMWQVTAWVGVSTDARAMVVVALQQASLIALLLLRASWLARAQEIVSEKADQVVSVR